MSRFWTPVWLGNAQRLVLGLFIRKINILHHPSEVSIEPSSARARTPLLSRISATAASRSLALTCLPCRSRSRISSVMSSRFCLCRGSMVSVSHPPKVALTWGLLVRIRRTRGGSLMNLGQQTNEVTARIKVGSSFESCFYQQEWKSKP